MSCETSLTWRTNKDFAFRSQELQRRAALSVTKESSDGRGVEVWIRTKVIRVFREFRERLKYSTLATHSVLFWFQYKSSQFSSTKRTQTDGISNKCF